MTDKTSGANDEQDSDQISDQTNGCNQGEADASTEDSDQNNPNNSPQQTTFSGTGGGGGGLSASVDDNVGLRVIMPTETEKRYYRHGAGGQLKGIHSLTSFINPKPNRQSLVAM